MHEFENKTNTHKTLMEPNEMMMLDSLQIVMGTLKGQFSSNY